MPPRRSNPPAVKNPATPQRITRSSARTAQPPPPSLSSTPVAATNIRTSPVPAARRLDFSALSPHCHTASPSVHVEPQQPPISAELHTPRIKAALLKSLVNSATSLPSPTLAADNPSPLLKSSTCHAVSNLLRSSRSPSPVSNGSASSTDTVTGYATLENIVNISTLPVINHLDKIGDTQAQPTEPTWPERTDCPYSHTFYKASLICVYDTLSTKSFITQRCLVVHDFASRSGLFKILTSACLLTTVQNVDKFVKTVVYEFYANLVPELLSQGKVYVRGKLFEFNPFIINTLYATPATDDPFYPNMDDVAHHLTGGLRPKWVSRDTVKPGELTSSYAYLYKIACSNWMPTRQHSYVPRAMAILLFKVATGVKTNIGKLLYDQILDARNGRAGRKELILPNLIYGLLVMQGFEKHPTEGYEAESKKFKIDSRLFRGSHVNDLSAQTSFHRKSNDPDFTAMTVQFLKKELQFSSSQREQMAAREQQIEYFLNTLQQLPNAASSDDSDSPAGATSASS